MSTFMSFSVTTTASIHSKIKNDLKYLLLVVLSPRYYYSVIAFRPHLQRPSFSRNANILFFLRHLFLGVMSTHQLTFRQRP